MSVRDFPPVELPEGVRTDRVSVTVARAYNSCERAAYLNLKHKGGPASVEMRRGSALHRVVELSIQAMLTQGEPTIPQEIVKDICNDVLADPAYPVPFEEHDYIRESVYRWARDTVIDPAAVVAVETLFTWEVEGFHVRAKIDYAEAVESGAAVHVKDWKSSRAMPAFEEVSRKRSDGTLAAKNFQLVLYALMLAYGVPVRVEECAACSGKGYTVSAGPGTQTASVPCRGCEEKGRVEIPEPFPLADRAQRFDLEFVYPGIEGKDGLMATRPVSLTRLELDEYRASLVALLRRLRHSFDTGEWPAVPGDHCSECPASWECPIPRHLRDYQGAINTLEEAAEAATLLDRRKALDAALQKELKAFAKAQGVPIRFGANQVLEFGYMESERIADKEAMFAAMERAVRYGDPFERSKFVKTVTSTPFRQRTLTDEELAEEKANESEGSNGSAEQSLDERYGADAPY